MTIVDFRDLEVYRRSQEILPVIKRLCITIKENKELSRNLMKTACQIAPVIAEGYAKKSSTNEFKRYLGIAIGSTNEMIAHLDQVRSLHGDINRNSIDLIIREYEVLAKQLQVLKKVWHKIP